MASLPTRSVTGTAPGILAVLRDITRDPALLVRSWNWKSALVSALVRSTIFFSANLPAGRAAAWAAFSTEICLRLATSGFYGGLTQQLGRIEPEWKAIAAASTVLPLVSHGLELLVHLLRGTPELLLSITASVAFTVVSTSFNTFAMRRGALTTGRGSQPLHRDLRRLPRLIAEFLAMPVVALRRRFSVSPARSLCVAALVLALWPAVLPARGPAPEAVAARIIERLGAEPATRLGSYRARRHMAASARKESMRASLDAWTMLEGTDLRYEVIREDGSTLIRKHVLKAALAAERDVLASGESSGGAISPVNYEFLETTPEEGGTVRLTLRPRRAHKLLLNGTVVVDEATAELVAVEGLLSKRPSFWTRRVHVERRYARAGGVNVPMSMRSTADVLIGGRSTFEMYYCYESVNGQVLGSC